MAVWADDNGNMVCENHAGMYLTGAIKQRPKAKSHRTPLGTWELLTAAEVAEMSELLAGMYGEGAAVCESCRFQTS